MHLVGYMLVQFSDDALKKPVLALPESGGALGFI